MKTRIYAAPAVKGLIQVIVYTFLLIKNGPYGKNIKPWPVILSNSCYEWKNLSRFFGFSLISEMLEEILRDQI